jgi:uncharacterized protein (UPF0335 family)
MPSRNWRTINRLIESLWEIIMTIEISEEEREQLSDQIKKLYDIRKRQ